MKPFRILAVAACAVILFSSLRSEGLPDQLAIQTWTLRNMNFDQVVAFAKEHGIKELQLIPNHIDYKKETVAQIEEKKAKLQAAGLHAYTYGVAGTSMNPAENRALFQFCKSMNFKVVVVEPGDFRIWDNLESLAKEFDIRVAVHNHGIKSLYGNPAIVKQIIDHRDSRIGVCMDIGWITSAGFDAAEIYKQYKGRVFDLHLKDKRIEKTQGDDVYFDTHIGEGKANLAGLFKELKASGYAGRLAIETDSGDFAKSPAEFVTKAKAFVAKHSQ